MEDMKSPVNETNEELDEVTEDEVVDATEVVEDEVVTEVDVVEVDSDDHGTEDITEDDAVTEDTDDDIVDEDEVTDDSVTESDATDNDEVITVKVTASTVRGIRSIRVFSHYDELFDQPQYGITSIEAGESITTEVPVRYANDLLAYYEKLAPLGLSAKKVK